MAALPLVGGVDLFFNAEAQRRRVRREGSEVDARGVL